ncbi:cache domain-containing sensor histidine kinase [Neobacillus muris]|uniref:cache domain-containing sensor histidine kinase n=1 Tax=Neobacillus muris TaxID=2941334 RepID=UPI00203D2D75|nr:sensor histidine kinase [Neobacillus muris]
MIFKVFNKRNSTRLSTKLIITYILITVIPMGLLSSLAYYEYTKSIEEQVGEYIPKLLKQANNNLENNLSELENYPELIYSSNEVMGVLRDDSKKNQSRYQQDKFVVESFLTKTYLENSPDILGAFILSKNRAFVSTRVPYDGFNLENLSLPYGEEHALGDKIQMLMPYRTALKFEGNPPFLLLMKQITDFDNRKSLGTIFLAVKLSFIEKVLSDLEEEKNAELSVMDEGGQIIYHTNPNRIGTFFPNLKEYPIHNGSFQSFDQKGPSLISINQSASHKWILVHSIPLKYLTKSTDIVKNVTVFAFVGLVIITTIISIILAWTVTKPIKRLGNIMQEVEQGNLDVYIPVHGKDEVGVLAHSFDSMIRKLRELIKKNYTIEIRQKDAELYALQSQINPHFMYNTLQTISMAVEEGESEAVVEMVTVLGRMLRYSLTNNDRLVPISKEVEHVNDFLRLQRFRFEERLTFEIKVEIKSDEYFSPKFILQPIIENSIKYGLEKRKILKIEIVVREIAREQGSKDIVFIIRDNGPGISSEQLADINLKLRSDPMGKRESGFGMMNVHARVAMLFGNQYELKVKSKEGTGTEVTIQIPIITKNEVSQFLAGKGMVSDE